MKMKKIIAKVNREIDGRHWNRYFEGKLKPIDHKIHRIYKWLCRFIPYDWFVTDGEINIYESKEDELWIEDDDDEIVGNYIEA